MKILVIGLDCAAPEIVFSDLDLPNIRQLMDQGCYGKLESIIPPITVPAWMCMSTSQDPGSLGIYGFRNRTDYSYSGLGIVDQNSVDRPAIWDALAKRGMRSIVVGVPPSYPPRKMAGVNIGCFLTPDPRTSEYTYPPSIKQQIEKVVGEYPVDVKGFRTDQKQWLLDQIYDMTKKHFEALRYLMATQPWDYFQFVEIGVDRLHHGFWKFHDPSHRQYEPGNPFENVIRDYYKYIDTEIGSLLELLDDDTIVMLVSDHGAQRLDGGFCVNEWLRREGLLVLKEEPSGPAPFSPKLVDWSKTKVWSEGGYYARVFVNVQGREPEGVIPAGEYDAFLDEMTERLKSIRDDRGRVMDTLVFRPGQIYKEVRRVAPDLVVHFDSLYWRSIGGVGYPNLHVEENDTGPDDCNHAQFGTFILSAPNLDLRGEIEGVHLLDVAPTLLDLAGVPVPEAMQGRPITAKVRV
ncbi:MAG: alkaline phosphatase family protein [Bryobacteraceae bacterium]|nr:alkaline phosphatase family protein [Bryobacteraceae bacterium]